MVLVKRFNETARKPRWLVADEILVYVWVQAVRLQLVQVVRRLLVAPGAAQLRDGVVRALLFRPTSILAGVIRS